MIEPYKPLYTVAEASKVLKCNADLVYRFIKSGTLPSLRLGRIKIRGIDLERFINSFPVELPDTTDNEEREVG